MSRNTIGAVEFASAYGIAQQLQDALGRGETGTVQQFVRLKAAASTMVP
jgi:hypothetical protein